MVRYAMITLDTECRNVQVFIDWCVLRGVPYEIHNGKRVENIEASKPHLTSYGYYVMNNWRESPSHFDTTGPVGCFLAHREAWTHCVRMNESMWVFEEGVRSYNTDLFDRVENDYPGMDLVLGHTVPVLRFWRQRRVNNHRIGSILRTIDKIYFGTKCYRLSPAFAARLLTNCGRFDVHVDTFLCTEAMYYQDEFKVGRTTNPMVVASSSGLINHSVDQSLLIVSCLVVSTALAVGLTMLAFRAYRRCRRQCPIPSLRRPQDQKE